MAVKGKINPTKGKVFVKNLEFGQRKSRAGIILTDDDMKDAGIRPRWAQIYAMADDINDIEIGEWVLIEHGRWTTGIEVEDEDGSIFKIWMIEYPKSVLLASDVYPDNFVPVDFGDVQ